MNKKFRIISYALSVVGGAFTPLKSFAVQMESIWPTGWWGNPETGLLGCNGSVDRAIKLGVPWCNALGFCGIVQVLLNVVSFGISIAFFVLMPIFLVWGGIIILTSGGNPGKLGEGKKILTGTLVGVLITLGGYLIVKMFVDFLDIGKIGGFGGNFLGC
ncbi:MAG: hypothetical protein A2945_01870 [Candidatus Liptonbacteria bacterium RIFCSPLOWO2_01_FULL_52_25]|uniref:Uncharacterized protein n=1 Tax=Candidatus Liptonbacteria bacterium RIFCSPLOWO2_01_FULL_52_25 TaxID=1798650 RepID=A0A1G2CH38_9BACT|nr:MAG: hypothetical protein A2945_01870 [Candidatus Liptonbacteria bacterium RIFCSPLOWO2_01_FULL_52_25]